MFDLADRITVMLQGKLVGTVDKDKVTKDEVLAMIIMGKKPGEVTETELAELHAEAAAPASSSPVERGARARDTGSR